MTLTLFAAALILGFLGSFHCIGMCGPIALTLPVQHLRGLQKLSGIFVYNAGRVFTYSILGLVFGLIGMSFQLFGWQQFLSVALGSLLLAIFVATLFKKRLLQNHFIRERWNTFIIRWLTPLYQRRSFGNLFLIGFLNGLLPCGLVYMAVAGALATASILSGSLFMAFFGLATLPAMVAMSFAGGFITLPVRNRIKKTVPYILCFMGILLILRGLDLNIPYISPSLGTSGSAIHCH